MTSLFSAPKTLVASLALACCAIAVIEYLVVAPIRADQVARSTERDRISAENAATEANLLSADAVQAWLAKIDETDKEWRDHLERIPDADRVDAQYTDLKDLARASGVNLLAFERRNAAATKTPPPKPGQIQDAPAVAVSPGVERRQIAITFGCTIESLGRFHEALSTYKHPIAIDEYKATAKQHAADTIEVEMSVSLYFRKRSAEAQGGTPNGK